MKMKSILVVVFLFVAGYSYGQLNMLNAQTSEEIGQKNKEQILQEQNAKPFPYGYTDERDILWGKMVWEYIDLNQMVNFPLLYPLDTGVVDRDRLSLYQVLLKGIEDGDIKHIYADSYFNRKRTLDELDATLYRLDTLDEGRQQLNAGEALSEEFIDRTDVDGSDVQGFRIRGYWYFDKRQSDMRYRLIGICPMVRDAYSKSQGIEDSEPVELFWVFYPEARDVLYKARVFNEDNSAHSTNFDEILNARRFSAVVYKSDNTYGDREIRDYMTEGALKQLMEADRIKGEIRDFEASMWNY